jgi:DNA-binding IclR family transcriptional regulator
MGQWNFLTNHARALLCVARDPGVRLRDIAGTVGISERRAFGIVSDLVDAGYLAKDREADATLDPSPPAPREAEGRSAR